MSGDTVTGKALQFTNDNKMCYAFSGAIESNTAERTILDFETTSVYIDATLVMTAPIRFADLPNGQTRGYKLSFNGEIVGMYKAESAQEDMPTYVEVKILIPPNTHVTLDCRDVADASTYHGTANLIGRVGMAQRVGNLDE
tara:strand:+ start:60 stop:482 length:423 start_codon:yes stop_codon:yes gene_type:complete